MSFKHWIHGMKTEDEEGARSPGSTIATSEIDEHHASSPTRPDPRTSLQHVLDAPDSSRNNTPTASVKRHEDNEDEVRTPGETAQKPRGTGGRKKKDPAMLSSIYAGNKIKHLKKDDGEPLWRKDIQYDFLKAVFEDDNAVFTNSYEPDTYPKQTFANLYIDTMARSSKTSKILRDKLLTEHEPAKNMAMVCLLVNLGRMNTTLNFFPEMRAQLRTYHAIPSLQAHQDPNSYKQLQDAPRLKSILKGASEDRIEPNSVEKIKARVIPRTNPVNLIFVLSQYAPKITELHFPPNTDFYDMLMEETISSVTRARAFLWLMWFYLESDFTEEGADENPFGAGVDYQVGAMNQGVPRFEYLTPEQREAENVDTPEEKDYGYTKMRERKRIIEADQAAFQAEHGPPKRGPKPKLHLPPDEAGSSFMNRIRPKLEDNGASPASIMNRMRPKYESDMDSTRSTPPPRSLAGARVSGLLGTSNKARGSLKNQIVEGSSPIAPTGETVLRRSRPLTAHQLAVERNRNQRVDYILTRGIRKVHHKAKKIRRAEGPFWRAIQRTQKMEDPFEDSEDEESLMKNPIPFRERGFGGLIQLENEEDDFGEELASYAAAFRRMGRRLSRWDAQKDRNLGVIGTNRVAQPHHNGLGTIKDDDETEDERPSHQHPYQQQRTANGRVDSDFDDMDREPLDPMDKEILGMGSEPEEDLDDVDKALLGMAAGDETEEESGMDVD